MAALNSSVTMGTIWLASPEGMTSHASQSTCDIIEALKADTDQFRDGAEQNDDLTMLAFRITNRQ